MNIEQSCDCHCDPITHRTYNNNNNNNKYCTNRTEQSDRPLSNTVESIDHALTTDECNRLTSTWITD